MAVSTVPAVKARLVTLFDAALTIPVRWSAPTDEEELVREMVWLGDVRQTEEWARLGGQKIDEEYTVEVVVQVFKEGDSPQTTEERAWTLRESCVSALRTDLTLGGVVNQWVGPFSTRMELLPAGDQWLARATIELTCRARI